jgi:murein DD-endopeptidase MepM/ murein hydrolase activator NlpD
MRLLYRMLAFAALSTLALSFVPRHAIAAPLQGPPETYTVLAGDTLSTIAARFHTTVAAIQQLNGMGSSDAIQVGQKLLIPTGDAPEPSASSGANTSNTYIVQPGDTLYRIALRHGTTVRALDQLNGISNPNLVAVGQGLAIPGAGATTLSDLILDPPTARQGGTLMIQVIHPDLAAVAGNFNGKALTFTRSAGFFYTLVGISRCAKTGNVPLSITTSDTDGRKATESKTVTITPTTFPVQAITLPPSKGGLLDNTLQTREAAQLASIVGKYTPSRLWNGAWRQPASGQISSIFGTRRSYNGGPVGACGHEGTDYDEDAGTLIYAPARGQVVFTGLTQVRGNLTVIDHGLGVFSAYFHQTQIDVAVGQLVEPGTVIGKVGTTGLSTGPHLHWSVFVNGDYVDPGEWTRRMIP